MGFLRNPEIKKTCIFYAVLNAVFIAAAFIAGNITAGIIVTAICVLTDIIHLSDTYLRYRNIKKLSHEIDKILHGGKWISEDGYSEGELSILRNEIGKMTIKLCEQTEALTKEKTHLTDSIADISHQLRTPLTSINLIISFLKKSTITETRRIQLAKELEKLTMRLDWLISSLLKLSKLDAGTANFRHDTVRVSEVIAKAYAPLAIPMEVKEQELSIELCDEAEFCGDTAWTVEAISNIMKNCMEHTPVGGRICIKANENAIFTEIEISDNGPGITAEDMPYLFERFYKGSNSGETSVGIGLALAQKIVQEQNGTIKAANNTDGGANFKIKFYKSTI